MRRILNRDSYLKDLKEYKYTIIKSINEEAPFANDIPWGDSLIGRLINSISRKTKITFNKRRISGLVNGLKSTFDEMLEIGKYQISSENNSLVLFLKISDLLGQLEKQVNDEEDVDILISTTQLIIDNVSLYEYDNKDVMMRSLNAFLDFLKSLKNSESSHNTEEISGSNSLNSDELLKYSRSLLQSIVDIDNCIKNNVVRIGGGKESHDNKILSKRSRLKIGHEYYYTNDKGDKKIVKLISLDHSIKRAPDKKWLTGDDIKVTEISPNVYIIWKLKKDDYSDVETGQSVNPLRLSEIDSKVSNPKMETPSDNINTHFNDEKYKSLLNLYQKNRKMEILKNIIEMAKSALSIYKSKNDKNKILYYSKEIREKESLYNRKLKLSPSSDPVLAKTDKLKKVLDNYEYLFESEANLQKIEVHAKNAWKKVVQSYNSSRVAKYIPQIESLLNVSIEDGKEDFQKSKSTIKSICDQIVKNKETIGKPILFDDLIVENLEVSEIAKSISLFGRIILAFKDDLNLLDTYGSATSPMKLFIKSFNFIDSQSSKKESFGYANFLMIKERNEFSSQIKEKFDDIFTEDIRKHFEISDQKKTEYNNSIKELPAGEFHFSTYDPIIEIVRLFNRAWRIHTPGVIPSGRTNGQVSNSVFREYENLGGSGDPSNPGSGPYRNIVLYENWFEAIQDILSDVKYRPIFGEKTVFKFGNGDPIDKGGKILLRFVNSLLSDSKMYTGGAMSKFISEYFNLDSKDVTSDVTAFTGFKSDIKDNKSTSEGILQTDVTFIPISELESFKEKDLYKLFKSNDFSKFKNLSFRFTVNSEENKIEYYCTFKDIESGYPILFFSTGRFPYDLTKVTGISKNTTLPSKIYIASLEKINGIFKEKSISKIRFIDLVPDIDESNVNGVSDKDRISFNISKIEILCESDSKDPYLGFSNNYIRKSNLTSQKIDRAKIIIKK